MNRKWMIVVLAALLALAALVSAQADESPLSSEEELLAFLGQCREEGKTEFDVALEKAFFDAVSADSFAALRVIELKAGISSDSLRYSMSGTLMFSEVVWGANAAECATVEDARNAVLGFAAGKAREFQLICTPELSQTLRDDNLLFALAAQGGVDDMRMSYSLKNGLIYIKDVAYTKLPYAVISNAQQFTAAVEGFAAQNAPSFRIVFTPEFYTQMKNDGLLRVMQASSPMDDYRSKYNNSCRWYEYSNVTYSDIPRVVCETEEDIVEAIRQMGGIGAKAFNLILTEALYDNVHANSFKPLRQLETEAGMTSSSMAYNYMDYVLYYTDAVIVSNVVKLNTPEEAIAYTVQCAAAGDKEIALFCSDELYTLLIGNISPFAIGSTSMSPIYDVAAQAGLFDYTFSYSAQTHIIVLKIDALYPGAAIVNALRSGDEAVLSERERLAWQAAAQLAEACAAGAPLDTARNIHDRLCDMIVYTDDENTDEDDTAIGALLNGQANCDGYADAFYLVGTLAGLNVRYQHGDSYDVGLSFKFGDTETHMWNLIEIDGSWRLIDVTWDDGSEAGIRYTWFNLGQDRAARMHIWNSETSVPLLAETDLSVRPENEYLAASKEEAVAAIDSAFERQFSAFEIIFSDEDAAAAHHDVLNEITRRAAASFQYSWNDKMLTLSIYGL